MRERDEMQKLLKTDRRLFVRAGLENLFESRMQAITENELDAMTNKAMIELSPVYPARGLFDVMEDVINDHAKGL